MRSAKHPPTTMRPSWRPNGPLPPCLRSLSAPPAEILCSTGPWQPKLTPVKAPAFRRAELLLAADCAAYAHAAFHDDFIRGRAPLIGCPKLDGVDYAEKLTAILRDNEVIGLTVARMEVPCCGGLEQAARRALARPREGSASACGGADYRRTSP